MSGGRASNLRILVVNWLDRENPQAGGAELHLHETFGRMAEAGHEVTLLCSAYPGAVARAELDGIDVHRRGSRYGFSLAAPLYFRRRLAEQAFDVIVEDLNKVPVFTPLWSAVPVVLLVHHLFGATAFSEASLPLATATWLLERPVPRIFRARPIIAVSESTADDLVARGCERDRISVVHNGVDLGFFSPGGELTPYPSILYLGRLKRYKRVELVLEALAQLRKAGLEAELVVAGTGDHERVLRAQVEALDLVDHVEFRGYVSDEEKRELYRRSWVHVFASAKEGWGLTNVEAGACGTPSVVTDSPGLRESVVDGVSGYVVPEEPWALATALARVLKDPAERDRLGGGALSFARGKSWDGTAQGVEDVLRRAVGCP